eukprot:gnl/Trimastix_PCT/3635.p1 GENE.gnl/Trimastix_PCT/3635~~gnl/Trimastix_PCT/3635.p1  ORF type:complete len:781 (-),score=210.92 gnl/Trimastix_PCT/3635:421-2763(-)
MQLDTLVHALLLEIAKLLPYKDLVKWRCTSGFFRDLLVSEMIHRRRVVFLGCAHGDLKTITEVLKLDPDLICWKFPDGTRPLHLAAENGHLDLVNFLLRFNARMRGLKTADRGETPVRAAFRNGHVRVVFAIQEFFEKEYPVNRNRKWTELHRLALLGDHQSITAEHEQDVNCQDDDGWTPLHASIHGRTNLVMVRYLLEKGSDPTVADSSGRTPLHYACAEGQLDAVQLMLDHGADLNLRDDDHWQALHYSCFEGHIPVLRLLLDRGADLASVDCEGSCVCHHATIGESLAVLEYLHGVCGLDPRAPRDMNGRTTFHAACYGGSLQKLQYLISLPPPLAPGFLSRIVDHNGITLMHEACLSGRLDLVRFLHEEHGVGLEPRDNKGRTPLFEAIQSGSAEVIEYLIQHGVDVNHTSESDHPPMRQAVQTTLIIVKMLHEAGARLDILDASGQNLLHYACFGEGHTIIPYLHEQGGLPLTYGRHRVITDAAASGNVALVKYMHEARGINLGKPDGQGVYPIHTVCESLSAEMLRYMVEHGAAPNVPDPSGQFPVHLAAIRGDVPSLRVLIDAGANIRQLTERDRQSCMHYAGSFEMLLFLHQEHHLSLSRLDIDQRAPLHMVASATYVDSSCLDYIMQHLLENGEQEHLHGVAEGQGEEEEEEGRARDPRLAQEGDQRRALEEHRQGQDKDARHEVCRPCEVPHVEPSLILAQIPLGEHAVERAEAAARNADERAKEKRTCRGEGREVSPDGGLGPKDEPEENYKEKHQACAARLGFQQNG